MSEQLFQLWLDGFCGLVVPFPRLETMRRNPHLVTDWDEYKDLERQSKEYWDKKHKAQSEFFKLSAEVGAK